MTIENISQMFKALSDPIRLKIVYLLLQNKSLCVCEIVSIFGLSQSTVSRHLAYLKNSGLVNCWRDGVWMHYSLKQDSLNTLNLDIFKTLIEQTNEIELISPQNESCG